MGGLYLVPCLKSYLIAGVSVMVSVFVIDAMNIFWSSYGIPFFSLPFTCIVLIVLYVLKQNKYPYITEVFLGSPEENLENHTLYKSRFNNYLPQPYVPFSEEWVVYQAFNGDWTHKGSWAYAVDFVITDKHTNKTYKNDGHYLRDYYCYKQKVTSPVSGYIISICNEHLDNAIGQVDTNYNWGNYVIIKSNENYYVELSHLAKNTILVKPGDYVNVGDVIGRCGNTGYSPEPHIHMQVQYSPYIGAPTVPFFFKHGILDNNCHFNYFELKKGQKIKPAPFSLTLANKFQFILDDVFIYEFIKNGKQKGTFTVKVKIDIYGNYYLHDETNKAALYYSNIGDAFTCIRFEGNLKSPLKHFFTALPRIPFTDVKVAWEDYINPILILPKVSLNFFLKSFHHTYFQGLGKYEFVSSDTIKGEINISKLIGKERIDSQVILGKYKGIASVKVIQENKNCFEIIMKENNKG